MTWAGSRSICSRRVDTTRLISPVCALLGDGVELVEEQDATARACELERLIQSARRLAQEAGDDALVAHHVEREHQLAGEGLGQAGLAVPRGTFEQHAVPWLETVAPQQISTSMLLDELGHGSLDAARQLQAGQHPPGDDLRQSGDRTPVSPRRHGSAVGGFTPDSSPEGQGAVPDAPQ